jgi:uncharacterized RDD family membrane protein YckC
MSEGNANDLPKRPMPWEPGGSEPPPTEPGGTPPPDAPPPSVDAAPPAPDAPPPTPDATPTEVVPTPEPPPAAPAPPAEPPAAAAAAGLISAAPVGWAAPADPAGTPPTQWGASPDAAAAPIAPDAAPGAALPPPAVGWATPTTSGREVPGAPGLVFADTPSRFVAWLIDGFIAGLIGVVLGWIIVGIAASADLVTIQTSRGSSLSGLLVWIVTLLIDLVYFVFFWSGGRRATPGQRLFKIQVGNAVDGHSLDLSQALLRWLMFGQWLIILSAVSALSGFAALASFIWPLVLLVSTVSSPVKQGLHDRVAGTWVVKPADASNSGLIVGCLILLAILVILPLIALIGLIAVGSQVSTILSTVGDSI